jgi:hypothetical protein
VNRTIVVHIVAISPQVDINNLPIPVSGTFSDCDDDGSHTAVWDWRDGSPPEAGTVDQDANTVGGSYTYAEPSIYTVRLTVSDSYPASDEETYQFIVIYDPAGGFVTGGGWIMSPPGAYAADPTLTGQANFGFVSKYKKGASFLCGFSQLSETTLCDKIPRMARSKGIARSPVFSLAASSGGAKYCYETGRLGRDCPSHCMMQWKE